MSMMKLSIMKTILLISSLDLDIYQIIETIHSFNGIAVLAHVLAKKFGIYEIYQGIPDDLAYDGIEVGNLRELKELKKDALLCVVNMSFITAMLII